MSCSYSKDFSASSFTGVENIFINEYLPSASGDYVKVYLYGLLYSHVEESMTFADMAKHLGLTEKQVLEAWDYWEQMGIIKKHRTALGVFMDYDIEFLNLRNLMYHTEAGIKDGAKQSKEAACGSLYDDGLKTLVQRVEGILGKTLSPKDLEEVFSWVREIGATEEICVAAVEYCLEKGKTGIKYMTKVVEQWTLDGLKTEEDAKARLETLEEKYGRYKQVLNILGLNRGATKAEQEVIDTWYEEWGFNHERVTEACYKGAFISSPNVKYVNAILEKWHEEAQKDGRNVNSKLTVTQAVLNKYYEHLRKEAEEAAAKRREELYGALPRIEEIDGELMGLRKRLSRSLLGGDAADKGEVKRLTALLEEERAVLLTENNFDEDYTDIKYSCDKCNDTGIAEDGSRCTCVKQRIGEAELWQHLSSEKR